MFFIQLILIYVSGRFLGNLFDKYLKLPALLGMVIAGFLIGKSGLNLIDDSVLEYKTYFMSFALIIILIKAGLGIEEKTLKRVGRPAILLGFVPCILEGIAVMFLAKLAFGFSLLHAGILGFMIAAVSPAVVIPSMVELKEKGLGMDKGIPVMNLAATSIDDVVSLSLFGIFLNAVLKQEISYLSFLEIPVSILLGILIAYLLVRLIVLLTHDKHPVVVFLFMLVVAVLAKTFTTVWVASLILIMAMGYFIRHHKEEEAKQILGYVSKTWNHASIFLFVLIGVIVDVKDALEVLDIGLYIILGGLILRFIGVFISLIGTDFNGKEKLFIGITNIPKATVQASVGGIPLALGIAGGDMMLNLAVLSIVATAPIGLILIRTSAPVLLLRRGSL